MRPASSAHRHLALLEVLGQNLVAGERRAEQRDVLAHVRLLEQHKVDDELMACLVEGILIAVELRRRAADLLEREAFRAPHERRAIVAALGRLDKFDEW